MNLHETGRHRFWLAEQNGWGSGSSKQLGTGRIDGVHEPEKGDGQRTKGLIGNKEQGKTSRKRHR